MVKKKKILMKITTGCCTIKEIMEYDTKIIFGICIKTPKKNFNCFDLKSTV